MRSANKIRWRAVVAALTLGLGAACATQAPLRPFTTDGCSDFPDGTPTHKTLWLSCCTEHDKAYWQGGTYNDRRKADQALQRCVANAGEPGIAALMLAGVRVGGSPYWPTRFRWGYGWSWLRGYRALSAAEQEQVRKALLRDPGPAR